MRLLLLSIYELGHQPVHVASPAAALADAGHEVRTLDLSVQTLEPAAVDWAEAVAVSVPMHTATRLAVPLVGEIRNRNRSLPIAMYGLYAGQAADHVDVAIEGEYEPGLIKWLNGLDRGDPGQGLKRHIGRSTFSVPVRDGLPDLDNYARLDIRGEMVTAGAVEASHGCRHRCRHCPIPAVYDGRMRVVPAEVVLADIDNLVEAGAGHVTFGDADFLNAPRHSIDLLEAAHANHPDVTFDATIKVSHILDHEDVWPHLASLDLLFVVSAFESVDEETLEILDKGHTVEDMVRALDVVRSAGIHLRPSWLPFMPWTAKDHITTLFRFIAENDLVGVTDPVQMAIRLLIPGGSLLEEHPAVVPFLRGYDSAGLTWQWAFADPEVEQMSKDLESIAAAASDCGEHFHSTLGSMWTAVEAITGDTLGPVPAIGTSAPRLTESWFCCAEPTASQAVSIGLAKG